MRLPYRITTANRRRYRTAHGLTSCRRAAIIDAYDTAGNQHIVHTSDISKHSAGILTKPASDPKPVPVEACGYCGHVGAPVQYVDEWPSCGYCGGV